MYRIYDMNYIDDIVRIQNSNLLIYLSTKEDLSKLSISKYSYEYNFYPLDNHPFDDVFIHWKSSNIIIIFKTTNFYIKRISDNDFPVLFYVPKE